MKTIRTKTKSKIRYFLAWALLIAVESLTASIPVAILGIIIVPLAKSTRACDCLGGELVLLCFAYWVVFTLIHHTVYDRIFGTKEGK